MKIMSDVGLRKTMRDEDWWWQYFWLSLLCSIGYAFEALLQIVPSLTVGGCVACVGMFSARVRALRWVALRCVEKSL